MTAIDSRPLVEPHFPPDYDPIHDEAKAAEWDGIARHLESLAVEFDTDAARDLFPSPHPSLLLDLEAERHRVLTDLAHTYWQGADQAKAHAADHRWHLEIWQAQQ